MKYDVCGCDQAISYEKRIKELETIIELMNGADIDLEGFEQGNTFVLMPVGKAKYLKILKDYKKQESWLKTMAIWLKRADDKNEKLKLKIKELEER